jgi:hypothetical protein
MTALYISFVLWVLYLLYLWKWLKRDKPIYLIIAGVWLIANESAEQILYGTSYMIYGWLAVIAVGSLYIIGIITTMGGKSLLRITSGEAN